MRDMAKRPWEVSYSAFVGFGYGRRGAGRNGAGRCL